MTPVALICLAFGGLIVACFCAIGSKVLHDFSRHELEEYCEKHHRVDRFGEILDFHEHVVVAVESMQTVGTVLLIFASLLRWNPERLLQSKADFLSGLLLVSLVLIAATIWIPWAIARIWSSPFLFHTWRTWRLISRVLTPLAFCSSVINTFLHRLAGRKSDRISEEEAFEDEIRSIVTEGIHDGLLEADAREMIEGVIELGDADVADIMKPRSNIDAMQADLPWESFLAFVIRTARSRIPVYGKNLDDVIGILHAKDLLPELAKKSGESRRSLRDLVRPPCFVPITKSLDDLLQEFLQTHQHLAIVVDEYQAVADLVTIEDVLEEIVGEIVDEHDNENEQDIWPINEQMAEVLGHAHLDEINEQLGLELPEEEEFDTIGGLVFSRLGRVPRRDEQLVWNNLRITILAASRRKIERLRIEILEHAPEEKR